MRAGATQVLLALAATGLPEARQAMDALHASFGTLSEAVRGNSTDITVMRERLRHPDPAVRAAAALALKDFGPRAAPALDDLRSLLHDPDDKVRLMSILALGTIGPAAASVAGELVALAADPTGKAPAITLDALRQIGPAAVWASDALLRLALSGPEGQRFPAGVTLGAIGLSETARARFAAALADDADVATLQAALTIVPYVHQFIHLDVHRLLDVYQRHQDSPVCFAAINAVAILPEREQAEVVAALRASLRGPDDIARSNAATAIRQLGPVAAAATDDLLELLRASSGVTHGVYLQTLARLGPAAGMRILDDVRAAMRSTFPMDRSTACGCLAVIGPAAAPALDALRPLLDDPAWLVRSAALKALEQIGPAAAVTVNEVRHLLASDPDENVRFQAAVTLRAFGPAAVVAVEELVQALGDGKVGTSAIVTLQRLMPALDDVAYVPPPAATPLAATVR
jgi:HEAT repeat protein